MNNIRRTLSLSILSQYIDTPRGKLKLKYGRQYFMSRQHGSSIYIRKFFALFAYTIKNLNEPSANMFTVDMTSKQRVLYSDILIMF